VDYFSQASSIEVDIDLLYEENLTIRQRMQAASSLVPLLLTVNAVQQIG